MTVGGGVGAGRYCSVRSSGADPGCRPTTAAAPGQTPDSGTTPTRAAATARRVEQARLARPLGPADARQPRDGGGDEERHRDGHVLELDRVLDSQRAR
jgi:hypothetical protein